MRSNVFVRESEGGEKERRAKREKETDREEGKRRGKEETERKREKGRGRPRDERTRRRARGAGRNAWERGASGPTAICPSRIPPTPRRALRLFQLRESRGGDKGEEGERATGHGLTP